jgi:SAM-dependent methyltransferase
MSRMLHLADADSTPETRDYMGRMTDDKVHRMKRSREYEVDYWDGEVRHGYGGHPYDGHWQNIVRKLVDTYRLGEHARILDVGCGKGDLLCEFRRILPGCTVVGIDVSSHALNHAPVDIREHLFQLRAQDPYPFADKEFDLVVSMSTLQNLRIYDVKKALHEIRRVGKNQYLVVESYRDEQELFNLQCWALTCESFFAPDEWLWLYKEFGYDGDYEFIYFENAAPKKQGAEAGKAA